METIQQTLKVIIKKILKKSVLRLMKEFEASPSSSVNWTSVESHIFEHIKEIVRALEIDPGVTTRRNAILGLRQLSLDDFGLVLLSMPNPGIQSFHDYFLKCPVRRFR